jgi:hypothetical protein
MANRIQDQAVFLGPGGAFAGYNESSLAYPGELGKFARVGDKSYQLVQVSGQTGTVGLLAFWKDRSAFLVSSSISHSDAGRNGVAGVFLGTVGNGNYGWVQIKGECTVAGSTSVATTGSFVIARTNASGVMIQASASVPGIQHVGVALTKITASPGTGTVDLLIDPQ